MPPGTLRRYPCGGRARKFFLRRSRDERRKFCDRRKACCVGAAQCQRKALLFEAFLDFGASVCLAQLRRVSVAALASVPQNDQMLRRYSKLYQNASKNVLLKIGSPQTLASVALTLRNCGTAAKPSLLIHF